MNLGLVPLRFFSRNAVACDATAIARPVIKSVPLTLIAVIQWRRRHDRTSVAVEVECTVDTALCLRLLRLVVSAFETEYMVIRFV